MLLILVSFFAGVLTILAPCVLPLLPIILGGSIEYSHDKKKPYIIIASLSVSIIIFSLLLKASTILIGVNPMVWKSFSGIILIFFGIITIFPNLWKDITNRLGLSDKSNIRLQKSSTKGGTIGAILIGFSLGPVFSSCSPTYAVILAVILPISIISGIINLLAYVLGLALMLLLISVLGQKLINKVKWASSPNGTFKRALGILFLIVGISIIMGYDKIIEEKVLDSGYFENLSNFEQGVIDKVNIDN